MNSLELMDALRPHWWPALVDVAWVGEGWHDLVSECHRTMVERLPRYVLKTIDDRDGELRFIAAPESGTEDAAAIDELLAPVVARAGRTCSWCGSPGSKRAARSWVVVLCDACDQRFSDPPRPGVD